MKVTIWPQKCQIDILCILTNKQIDIPIYQWQLEPKKQSFMILLFSFTRGIKTYVDSREKSRKETR